MSELKLLAVAAARAEWQTSTTGTEAAQREAAECETRLRLFLTARHLRRLQLDQVENQLPDER